jgi:transcriptional regulator with XRE-family HTH domain
MRIKEVMAERGITQAELAHRLNKQLITIKKTLAGNPTVETLERIADAIGVPTWHLFANPDDVCRRPKDELVAMVKFNGEYYHANTIDELASIVEKLKAEIKEE